MKKIIVIAMCCFSNACFFGNNVSREQRQVPLEAGSEFEDRLFSDSDTFDTLPADPAPINIAQRENLRDQLQPPAAPVEISSRAKLWPRDENIPLFVYGLSKVDLVGRRARNDVEMQWRQQCEERDSGWYNMQIKHGVQIDDDYVIARSMKEEEPDTVWVLASAMREIDPLGTCDFYFRCRVRAGRRFSEWDEAPAAYRLVDPLSLQVIEKPRLEQGDLR